MNLRELLCNRPGLVEQGILHPSNGNEMAQAVEESKKAETSPDRKFTQSVFDLMCTATAMAELYVENQLSRE